MGISVKEDLGGGWARGDLALGAEFYAWFLSVYLTVRVKDDVGGRRLINFLLMDLTATDGQLR